MSWKLALVYVLRLFWSSHNARCCFGGMYTFECIDVPTSYLHNLRSISWHIALQHVASSPLFKQPSHPRKRLLSKYIVHQRQPLALQLLHVHQWLAHVIASVPCTYQNYLPPNLQVLQFAKRHDWIVLGVEFLPEHHPTQSPSKEVLFGLQFAKAAGSIAASTNMYFILKRDCSEGWFKFNVFVCRGMNGDFSDAF